MLEYAPRGLFGVLTPQANTTVEAEFAILCPPGYGMLTGRLTSDKPTIDARLVDYVASMDRSLDQFANAPVGAVAFACTGAGYLVDPDEQAAQLAAIRVRRGYPVVTAVDAIADALAALDARRVGIVSPYGPALHDRALAYWRGRGLEIVSDIRVAGDDAAFHPIYALGAAATGGRLAALDVAGAEAVAILGTGLPSLPAIRALGGRGVPVVSPNLCLVWRTLLALERRAPDAASLRPWIDGSAWGARFDAWVSGARDAG